MRKTLLFCLTIFSITFVEAKWVIYNSTSSQIIEIIDGDISRWKDPLGNVIVGYSISDVNEMDIVKISTEGNFFPKIRFDPISNSVKLAPQKDVDSFNMELNNKEILAEFDNIGRKIQAYDYQISLSTNPFFVNYFIAKKNEAMENLKKIEQRK